MSEPATPSSSSPTPQPQPESADMAVGQESETIDEHENFEEEPTSELLSKLIKKLYLKSPGIWFKIIWTLIVRYPVHILCFITYDFIINKLLECDMKCHYCKNEMFIIYEFVRELSQWTVDRIDNSKGHNKDNIVLSCLNCNLKKRRTSNEKFLFTKQLNLIKQS